MLRGLEKNRDLRFATAVAFREAIETMLGAASGAPTTPASVRAAMPTARDMTGSPPTPIDTATVPARPANERFGTTANLTGQSGTRQKILVIAGVVVLLGGSAAVAIAGARARRAQKLAAGAPQAAAVAPAASPTAAPPAAAPPAAAPTAAAPTAPEERGPAPPVAAQRELHGKRRTVALRLAPPATTPAAPAGAGVTTEAGAAKPAAPSPAAAEPAAAPPQVRGLREVLAEAEKLLGQGEVTDACARGEEAARIAPKSPPAHKFLGKCYMRAGRTREANDNYKLYLELAPNAPDAPFVKSMIR